MLPSMFMVGSLSVAVMVTRRGPRTWGKYGRGGKPSAARPQRSERRRGWKPQTSTRSAPGLTGTPERHVAVDSPLSRFFGWCARIRPVSAETAMNPAAPASLCDGRHTSVGRLTISASGTTAKWHDGSSLLLSDPTAPALWRGCARLRRSRARERPRQPVACTCACNPGRRAPCTRHVSRGLAMLREHIACGCSSVG